MSYRSSFEIEVEAFEVLFNLPKDVFITNVIYDYIDNDVKFIIGSHKENKELHLNKELSKSIRKQYSFELNEKNMPNYIEVSEYADRQGLVELLINNGYSVEVDAGADNKTWIVKYKRKSF
jgi:hypothetical protein